MTTTLRKAFPVALVLALGLASAPSGTGGGAASAAPAVKIDSQLTRFFATHAAGATVPVIITYRQKPGAAVAAGTGLLLSSDTASGSDFVVQ